MSPPAAGTSPATRPTPDETANGLSDDRNSALFGHQRPSAEMGLIWLLLWVSIWSNSSVTPKRPMITARNDTPSLPESSEMPNVKR